MLLLCCLPASAQNPQLQTKNGQAFPTVVFTHVFWGTNPPYYSIAIDSTGNASYQSVPNETERTGVPYVTEFEADACRRTVFRLVEQTDFLRGRLGETKRMRRENVVDTLSYRDPHANNQITYNSSADANVRKLTSIFSRIAATMQFGRNLEELYRKRRQVGPELERLQVAEQQGQLLEVQVLRPILSQIVSDSTIDDSVRSRAQAVLRLNSSECE